MSSHRKVGGGIWIGIGTGTGIGITNSGVDCANKGPVAWNRESGGGKANGPLATGVAEGTKEITRKNSGPYGAFGCDGRRIDTHTHQ